MAEKKAENENGSLEIGKQSTSKKCFGLYLKLDMDAMEKNHKKALQSSDFDEEHEVFINLDGVERSMTFKEFKERLTTNKRG